MRALIAVLVLGVIGFGAACYSGAQALDKSAAGAHRMSRDETASFIQQDLEKYRAKAARLEVEREGEHERCARMYEMRKHAEVERDTALARVHNLEGRLDAIRSWTRVLCEDLR